MVYNACKSTGRTNFPQPEMAALVEAPTTAVLWYRARGGGGLSGMGKETSAGWWRDSMRLRFGVQSRIRTSADIRVGMEVHKWMLSLSCIRSEFLGRVTHQQNYVMPFLREVGPGLRELGLDEAGVRAGARVDQEPRGDAPVYATGSSTGNSRPRRSSPRRRSKRSPEDSLTPSPASSAGRGSRQACRQASFPRALLGAGGSPRGQ